MASAAWGGVGRTETTTGYGEDGSFPPGRRGAAAILVENSLLMFGGIGKESEGEGPEVAMDDFYRLKLRDDDNDAGAGGWQGVTRMEWGPLNFPGDRPSGRGHAGVAVRDPYVYFFAGESIMEGEVRAAESRPRADS
eukprot:1767334-Rhodomonas_salina.4